MSLLKHSGFRILLAVGVMLLTSVLLIQGNAEEVRSRQQLEAQTGWRVVGRWDHLAAAHAIAFSLNLPAFILTAPVRAITGSTSILSTVGFVLAAGLLWYWVGKRLDYQFGFITNSRVRNVGSLAKIRDTAVFLVCLGLLFFLIVRRETVSLLIFFSACAWLLVFLFLIGFKVFRRSRPATTRV